MNKNNSDYEITTRMQILSAVKSKNILKLTRLLKIRQENNKSPENDYLLKKIIKIISTFKSEE